MPFPVSDFTRDTIKKHFRRKHLEWTEDYFIKVLEESPEKFDIYWAVLALRDCGTMKSVPALQAKLYYPKTDVKACSILTIAHIARASATPLYTYTLLDPKYTDKAYAMWAIEDAADERAIEAVMRYFKKNMSKIRRQRLPIDTIVHGLAYLRKYVNSNPEVASLVADIEVHTGLTKSES